MKFLWIGLILLFMGARLFGAIHWPWWQVLWPLWAWMFFAALYVLALAIERLAETPAERLQRAFRNL